MPIRRRSLSMFSLALLALLEAGCASITVPNSRLCTPAGTITNGADCAYTLSSRTEEMDFAEFVEFLEAQPARPDPARPGHMLPERGGAICQSAADWTNSAIALEQACLLLGKRCRTADAVRIVVAKGRIRRLERKSVTAMKELRR